MELTENILRQQLKGTVADGFTNAELHRCRNDLDRFGKPFLERDRLIFTHERRYVSFLRQHRSRRWQSVRDLFRCHWRWTDRFRRHAEFCRAVAERLHQVLDDETIYFWYVQQDGQRIGGISTPLRLIGVFPKDYMRPEVDD